MRLGPIDFEVPLDGLHHFVNQVPQLRGVVQVSLIRGDRFVKRQFLHAQVQLPGPLLVGLQVAMNHKQRLDHGRGVNQPVVIPLQRFFQQLLE